MSKRKLNALEIKLHQTALSDPNKTLSQKQVEELAPDAAARTAATNFLLGTGMLKMLKDARGHIEYRAVMKKELDIKKDMSGEEAMVLSHIQAAANEGIWTKHLKVKTELHQTIIDRCLKSLVSKNLIKAEKSVKHPTRKIYMLAHLQPSVEMTGGPWYTDNELDTEFIKLLSTACLHYIKDRSFPKKRSSQQSSNSQILYPISAGPSYPSAQQIQLFLSKSKITETALSVDHVEMLLNVLVLDGEIEKVPAFGAAMWESNNIDDEEEEENNDDGSDEDDASLKKKRKRKSEKEKEKDRKRKRRKQDDDSDSSDTDDSDHNRKAKRKKRKVEVDDQDSESDSDSEPRKKSHKKRSKSKSKRPTPSDSSSSDSEDRSKKSASKRSSKSVTKKSRSESPRTDFVEDNAFGGGAFVYRAVRQERVALGWSQAPCGKCPVFEFCKDKGPVNAAECTYYEEWLKNGVVAEE